MHSMQIALKIGGRQEMSVHYVTLDGKKLSKFFYYKYLIIYIMNKESPITEFIIDPICKKIFNSIKIKEKGFGQLTLISLVFCVYYLLVDNIDRSSIFYVLSYLFFYIYNKKVYSNDNDMLYFLTNLCIIILVFKS